MKSHTILACEYNKIERNTIINKIMELQPYNVNSLLYLEGNFNMKLKEEITCYIVRTIRACGMNFTIDKNFR